MEIVALVLSIVSTLISLFSVYLSQFKRGTLELLPLRAYRITPINFTGPEPVRAMRLFLSLTFNNTGANKEAVHDLRLRLSLGANQDLFLRWEHEIASIDADSGILAPQPTIKGYESLNKSYSFASHNTPTDGQLVNKLEQMGQNNQPVQAILERRVSRNTWETMGSFQLLYSGRQTFCADYDSIHPTT